MTENNIVLSITTIGSRIHNLPKILNSIINKTELSFIIHIFYSNEPKLLDIGCDDCSKHMEELNKFISRINSTNDKIQIKLTKTKNIGSYRKIIPALKLYKSNIIITIDDDEIFEDPIVDIFVKAYREYGCIISSVGRIIDFANYSQMTETIDYYKQIYMTLKPQMNLLPEGYGGILYHSNMFNDDFIDFDYDNLNGDIIKNDDIFIRTYTFKKNIPVMIKSVYQSNIYNYEQTSRLYDTNKLLKLNYLIVKINEYQNEFNFNIKKDEYQNLNDINELLELYEIKKNNVYKRNVNTGTDVKKFNYVSNKNTSIITTMNFNELFQDKFFPNSSTNINAVLINLEKDVYRYESAIGEFKKLNIENFVHLKATYWKNRDNFIQDMNNIIDFIKEEKGISDKIKLHMDIFSNFNDPNIHIQDGPLACYCSHLRALIYGYLHFQNYTLIVEDDLHINSIDLIKEAIENIPNDWDMICFGASPINKFYGDKYYKFTDLFHSTHFYVVRNSSIKFILSNVYPVTDQIDILYSQMNKELNIYNVPNSILQKNYESNTQNNLYVMYNSPNYKFIRICIGDIKEILFEIIIDHLKISHIKNSISKYIKSIVLKILFDVIFSCILSNKNINNDTNNNINANIDIDTATSQYDKYFLNCKKEKLHSKISVIIDSCIKGIDVSKYVDNIVSNIYGIIYNFNLTNVEDEFELNKIYIPHNYGSTANVYLLIDKNNLENFIPETIIKSYIDKPRWIFTNNIIKHNNSSNILSNELKIINKLNGFEHFQSILFNSNNKIYLKYVGTSLFDEFNLPNDWEKQFNEIFETLNNLNISYPEFNLKNITCLNNTLYFIDFGLATIYEQNTTRTKKLNESNLNNFISIMKILKNEFEKNSDVEQQHLMYYNFIMNVKLDNLNTFNDNIF